jgi:nucleotide-binding universal stress UspA family protein
MRFGTRRDEASPSWRECVARANVNDMLLMCASDATPAGQNAARIAGYLSGRLRAGLISCESGGSDGLASLATATHDTRCDLLILGYPHRRRSWSFGTAEKAHCRLLRRAACPIMLIADGAGLPTGASVVLGYSVPEVNSLAAATAGRLAAALATPLVIVHSRSHGPTAARATGWQLYDAARRVTRAAITAGGPQLEVSRLACEGRPAEHLVSAAGTHDAALVVVGHRRTGRQGPAYGPMATRLQRDTPYPVVVVPSVSTA